MKTRILVKEGEYQLSKAFCMDPKIDAQELYCYLTGLDKVSLFLKAEEEVDPETEEKYMELIRRRAERIPLQHITGVQEFMGYTFRVNPHVLIPRQDTEALVTDCLLYTSPAEHVILNEIMQLCHDDDTLQRYNKRAARDRR